MELEKLSIEGLDKTYAISNVKKEFMKAVNEPWTFMPPWKRYQEKLIEDLAVLEQEMERAIDLPQFEKLVRTSGLYCIRHPESKKNIRVIYMIEEGAIILLTAFWEKMMETTKEQFLPHIRDVNGLKWIEYLIFLGGT